MRFRPTFWATFFAVPSLVILVALGLWQSERRAWKHDLVARIEASAAGPAQDFAGLSTASDAELLYAKVAVSGVFVGGRTAHLFAPEGQGAARYRVIAPLRYTQSGAIVLVDLGSVSEDEKARIDKGELPVAQGEARIEGVVRPSEETGWLSAAPDKTGNRWYVRDVPAMAEALGVKASWPLIIQAEKVEPAGAPKPVPFRPDLPDNHLAYAVTWFSLAFILVVVYVLFHLKRRPD